jgi:hypothetical protein
MLSERFNSRDSVSAVVDTFGVTSICAEIMFRIAKKEYFLQVKIHNWRQVLFAFSVS